MDTTSLVAALPRFLTFSIFLLVCGFYLIPQHCGTNPQYIISSVSITEGLPEPNIKDLNTTNSTFDTTVQEFWKNVTTALIDAQPQCDPIRAKNGTPPNFQKSFKPLDAETPSQTPRDFTIEDETALSQAHRLMRTSAQRLGPKLPFSKGKMGLVATVNAENTASLLISLRILRRTGCDLPFEIFIDNLSSYKRNLCETVLPSLNARCVVLPTIYDVAEKLEQPNLSLQRTLAILFSSFHHVLFLDSASFPVRDPTVLFSTHPYSTYGLTTWPGRFPVTASERFYDIARISKEVSSSRRSTASGQMMLDKDKHRESLLMMVYYNYYGRDYFYPLLSSGSRGAEGMETVIPAAMAVGLPWYQVQTRAQAVGRTEDGRFRASGMAQADPAADFEEKTHPTTKSGVSENQNQNVPHPTRFRRTKSLHRPNAIRKTSQPIFMHHALQSLDPAKILTDTDSTAQTRSGQPTRMWGSRAEMQEVFGYDFEARVWSVMAVEGCREDRESEMCERIRAYVESVFGWRDGVDPPW